MIGVLIVLIVVGVCLHLVLTYIPLAAPVKTIIVVVAVLFLCIWLLGIFGVADIAVPRVR